MKFIFMKHHSSGKRLIISLIKRLLEYDTSKICKHIDSHDSQNHTSKTYKKDVFQINIL